MSMLKEGEPYCQQYSFFLHLSLSIIFKNLATQKNWPAKRQTCNFHVPTLRQWRPQSKVFVLQYHFPQNKGTKYQEFAKTGFSYCFTQVQVFHRITCCMNANRLFYSLKRREVLRNVSEFRKSSLLSFLIARCFEILQACHFKSTSKLGPSAYVRFKNMSKQKISQPPV